MSLLGLTELAFNETLVRISTEPMRKQSPTSILGHRTWAGTERQEKVIKKYPCESIMVSGPCRYPAAKNHGGINIQWDLDVSIVLNIQLSAVDTDLDSNLSALATVLMASSTRAYQWWW